MKVALSAQGTTSNFPIGRRLGISPYLMIADLDTGKREAVRNPSSSGKRGTGVEAIVVD